VLALRSWSTDPTRDLDGLPVLDAESFTSTSGARFMSHVNDALTGMMQHWQRALERALKTPASDHELTRELVRLRALLARRLQLARHPSLPEEIRTALWEGTVSDVTRLQAELEQGAMTSTHAATSTRAAQERLVRLLRSSRFTAILEPGYVAPTVVPTAASVGAPSAQRVAAPAALAPQVPAVPGSPRRRVFVTDN